MQMTNDIQPNSEPSDGGRSKPHVGRRWFTNQRTKEQQDFYNKMAGKKESNLSTIKQKHIEVLRQDKITDYMRNCIYWIEEYFEGNTTYEKYWSATEALKKHIKDCHLKAGR